MMSLFVAVGFIEQKAASGFLFFNRSEGALLPTGTFFHSVQKKHRSNHGSHGVSSFLFQVPYRFDDLHEKFIRFWTIYNLFIVRLEVRFLYTRTVRGRTLHRILPFSAGLLFVFSVYDQKMLLPATGFCLSR